MSAAWPALLAPEALHAQLGTPGLVVVDCRYALSDPAAGERAYAQGHVPGAHYAHLHRDLSGPHRPGGGRHPWPEAAAFAHRLAGWGVEATSRVVAYDDADGGFAARLWHLLRATGHREAAVLDGGWAAWCGLGLPVSTDAPASARAPLRPLSWRAPPLDADAVRAHLDAGGLLVDARAAERFRGEAEPIDPVAGHVPGAVNRPHAANLGGDGRFKPAAALRREFEALLDGRAPGQAAMMCGSGVYACHHLLAMAHAGLDGARLYAGSWSGWIEDPSRPVAVGDEAPAGDASP